MAYHTAHYPPPRPQSDCCRLWAGCCRPLGAKERPLWEFPPRVPMAPGRKGKRTVCVCLLSLAETLPLRVQAEGLLVAGWLFCGNLRKGTAETGRAASANPRFTWCALSPSSCYRFAAMRKKRAEQLWNNLCMMKVSGTGDQLRSLEINSLCPRP